ncbi:N-acetyltransferase [Paracoccus caeni]|uniref:N-acetyltransferase n=1 Tax=Paracoccus caeni TaxID=657651 RepID=A0A934W1L7_9RHOB|nr:GNAT family N-acetyltransferase [Paracoccus caeni]MBK4216929.1 N-acetyltransferase [Paracoccus caeni]
MSEITVTKEDLDGRHGRYVARVEGIDAEAELVFTNRGPGKISADHTGAPDALRGTGAAAALVRALIDDARENSFVIIPLCPYVRAQYAKHPEWADVFTTKPGEDPELPG